MKPAFNTIQDGKAALEELFTDDVFVQLEDIKKKLSGRIDNLTPDEISRAAVKISVLLCNVGGIVAEATAKSNESYIFRKFKYIWEFNSLKMDTVKQREMAAEDSIFEYHRAELINRFMSDFLKEYKEDYERLLSALQSRLRTLQGERISEYMDMKHGAQ